MISIPQMKSAKGYHSELSIYCTNNTAADVCKSIYNSEQQHSNEWLFSLSYVNMAAYKKVINDTTKFNDYYIEEAAVDYSLINSITIIVLLVANFIAITDVYNAIQELDYSMITPSDYALMISNVPTFGTKDEYRDYLTIVRSF
jgi:hypothetical protein